MATFFNEMTQELVKHGAARNTPACPICHESGQSPCITPAGDTYRNLVHALRDVGDAAAVATLKSLLGYGTDAYAEAERHRRTVSP